MPYDCIANYLSDCLAGQSPPVELSCRTTQGGFIWKARLYDPEAGLLLEVEGLTLPTTFARLNREIRKLEKENG